MINTYLRLKIFFARGDLMFIYICTSIIFKTLGFSVNNYYLNSSGQVNLYIYIFIFYHSITLFEYCNLESRIVYCTESDWSELYNVKKSKVWSISLTIILRDFPDNNNMKSS